MKNKKLKYAILFIGDNMHIGTDILYIPRLKNIIETNKAFIKKVYTKKEMDIANTLNNPLEFFATRFAAKEAIIKATNGEFDFNEIEILKEKSGKPFAHIINNQNIKIDISLSYDNEYTTAFCIVT